MIALRRAFWYGVIFAGMATSRAAMAQTPPAHHPPLASSDIDKIARLEMIEDRRRIDTLVDNGAELAALLTATHPEVRRRAAITVGRLADRRGVALLRALPPDPDTAVTASVVWALGQIHDTAAIPWLDSILTDPRSMPTVAAEAAIALGKIKGGGSRDALARFLAVAVASNRTRAAIGNALLSIGRGPRGDLAPIVRWARSSDTTIRWSATWALARLRDPAGVTPLLSLARDRSALIRSWAVRGIGKAIADSAGAAAQAEQLLLRSTRDPDRTVRTEAIRTLRSYDDAAAVALLTASLTSTDHWIAVSAAEGLDTIRSMVAIGPLVAAAASRNPCALRVTAARSLLAFARDTARAELRAASLLPAVTAFFDLANDTIPYCRTVALQGLRTLSGRLAADVPQRPLVDSVVRALTSAAARPPAPAIAPPPRTLADYRLIVEHWVVPAYNGAPNPLVEWTTPRGIIDLELYPGDAPLAVDDLVRRTEAGALVGTQFTRVVPDFVDQQETIRGGSRIRDEVNRRGLTRGNLAWATAGLDTGNPGYTLGHTPQPHNEGSFTSLGRVIRGMDAADRIELGDRIVAARMLTRRTP